MSTGGKDELGGREHEAVNGGSGAWRAQSDERRGCGMSGSTKGKHESGLKARSNKSRDEKVLRRGEKRERKNEEYIK